jgi:transposase
VRTAYKCRAYPDPVQASALNRTFGCVRVVWNRTLAWRRRRHQEDKTGTTFTQANGYLTAMNRTSTGLVRDHDVIVLAAGRAVVGDTPGHACGADVRHSGSSRVQSAVKQEPRPVRAGIPVHQGGE